MDVVELGCVAVIVQLQIFELLKKKRKKRRWWTHPTISNRLSTGIFHVMFNEHRKYPEKFFQFYRMSVETFDELLVLLAPHIGKRDTVMRRSIDPAERLVVTLRYLASGVTFGDLEFDFQISRKTILLIIRETCSAIWTVLQPLEMPTPNKELWLKKAEEFEEITQFPNCVGCIDGKHVRTICPPNSGSEFFNFKNFFSVVLMAVADAKYFFTAIDVGSYGREGDSSIFKKSNFGRRLKSEELDLPPDHPLPTTNICGDGPCMPYVLLGDEAFGLSKHVMPPYPSNGITTEKRIYNYRHCRARRVVECAFGILANKWRVLHSAMLLHPEFVNIVVQACCILHNFVRRRDGFVFEDTLSCSLTDLNDEVAIGGMSKGIDVRELFCEYFNGSGAVPWQNKRVLC